ncbi:MAG: hypothetical protein ACYTAN_17575 [Planctomycetota bacterium]|jgi:hypothetical protein
MEYEQEQTEEERREEVDEALAELARSIEGGKVRVIIGPTGAVAFAGWTEADRKRLSDVCAFRRLTAEGSWPLQRAVAAAEMQSGRKVNLAAIGSGVHSHDGGRTWSPGH